MVPRENCWKVSKIFLTLFDNFWCFLLCTKIVENILDDFRRFLTFFDVAENCRKVSKTFLTLFDFFYVALSAGPFCNPLSFYRLSKLQEWPRQTKPKKGQFMNSSQRAFRNKSSMWIVLVLLRKNTRIDKHGRTSWTFRFGPFFGLVYWGDSWKFKAEVIRKEYLGSREGTQTFAHKTFSGRPGHRSSRSGIRTKRFMSLGFWG